MTDNETTQKARRRLRISYILIALLLIIIAGLILFRLSLKSKLQARLDAIRAAGSLPDSLTDLLPAYLDAVPPDPFDGKDIRYKKLDTGFVVYCVGKDKKDDGGKEEPVRLSIRLDEDKMYDITFIVER